MVGACPEIRRENVVGAVPETIEPLDAVQCGRDVRPIRESAEPRLGEGIA